MNRTTPTTTAPLATGPVTPVVSQPTSTQSETAQPALGTVIKAAAVQMVFASRNSRDFITPAEVSDLEQWTGKASSFIPLWSAMLP